MNRTPCTANPQAWDTYRVDNGVRRKATQDELEYALRGCHLRCKMITACRALDPAVEMVQAGVVYTALGTPTTVERFLKTPPQLAACADRRGTRAGAARHRAWEEALCASCREADNKAKHGKRATQCRNGHPRSEATSRRDSKGRHICLLCRPECAPKPAVDEQVAA